MQTQTQQLPKSKCVQGEKENLGKHTVNNYCDLNQGYEGMEEKSKMEEQECKTYGAFLEAGSWKLCSAL